MTKTYICVVYDSINNSVFQSQVLAPLLARKKKEPELDIRIVSFEKDIRIKVPKIPGITFHIFKRYPFVHYFALLPNIIRLNNLLHNFADYELLARGPFAGYIAYYASGKNCMHITIQARGLAAEEYAYTTVAKKRTLLQQFRYNRFLELEKKIYSINNPLVTFQAVSPALKDYLSSAFGTKSNRITFATEDIPASISDKQKDAYRRAVRSELNIPQDAPVYCYSGSYKAWQCPDETIEYFGERNKINPRTLLLVLTPDIERFEQALLHAQLPVSTYRVLSVSHEKLLAYLAAADYGLLIRKNHIINFVSRPTKALEYHAAGLTVLHNDTVAYLKNLTPCQAAHLEAQTKTSFCIFSS